VDGLPSKAQPHGTNAKLALAQLQLYEHLYHDIVFQCSEQRHGALLQFVVSIEPKTHGIRSVVTDISQFSGSSGPFSN
jgi:hypothetical protein